MSPRNLQGLLLLVAFALAVSLAGVARAANPAAEQLFQDAVALMEAGSFAEACPKLQESQKLEARSGTLLNLAYCHEKQGRTATAWVEYKDAATLARTENRTDNADKATALAADLEPKLSRLRIDVASADVAVKVDGAAAVTGQPFPIDPGERVVTASAPGKQEWSANVTIGPVGDSQTLTVPALETAAAEPAAPDPAAPQPVEPIGGAPDSDEGGIPVWAWVSGAAGLVLVGVAVGFAVDQAGARDSLDTQCGTDRQSCPTDYDFASDYDRERRDFGLFVGLGAAGVIALGVGVVGIALGVTSSSDGSSAQIYVAPAEAGIRGAF